MLALARTMKPIADDGLNWDRDGWLLGTPNGVVDLRTGTGRAARPEDRITMSTAVGYDPAATCPRFEAFFADLFDGDAEVGEFVQRAIGYSLTG